MPHRQETSYQRHKIAGFLTFSRRFHVRRVNCPIRPRTGGPLLQGPMIAPSRFGSCWGILLSKILPYICGRDSRERARSSSRAPTEDSCKALMPRPKGKSARGNEWLGTTMMIQFTPKCTFRYPFLAIIFLTSHRPFQRNFFM